MPDRCPWPQFPNTLARLVHVAGLLRETLDAATDEDERESVHEVLGYVEREVERLEARHSPPVEGTS